MLRSFYYQSPPTFLRRWLYPFYRLQEDDARKNFALTLSLSVQRESSNCEKGLKKPAYGRRIIVWEHPLWISFWIFHKHKKKKIIIKHTRPPEQRLSKCWAWQIIQTASLLLLGSPCIPEIPYLTCAFS